MNYQIGALICVFKIQFLFEEFDTLPVANIHVDFPVDGMRGNKPGTGLGAERVFNFPGYVDFSNAL